MSPIEGDFKSYNTMKITALKIGGLSIYPPLALAPMADYTHAAFRSLVAVFGGCGWFFTEMLNSRIVATQDPERDPYLVLGRGDRPLSAQIGGREPEKIALAIRRIETKFDAFDINMGCTRGVIQRYKWGIWLMRDLEEARFIVKEARKATSKPLTVKIRSGFEGHRVKELVAFCQMAEFEGVDAIILHPRSGKDGFKRAPRYQEWTLVKKAIGIPLIGNGDIASPEEAQKALDMGCDGVMIGRAALIRPWIFRDMVAYLKGNPLPPPPDPVEVLWLYYGFLEEISSPKRKYEHFVNFCFWFFQNWSFALYLWRKLRKKKELPTAFQEACSLVKAAGPMRPYPVRPFLSR